MAPYTECENCSSIWSPGTEEYDCQQCSACGWIPGDSIDDDDDFYDDTDDDDHPLNPPIKKAP